MKEAKPPGTRLDLGHPPSAAKAGGPSEPLGDHVGERQRSRFADREGGAPRLADVEMHVDGQVIRPGTGRDPGRLRVDVVRIAAPGERRQPRFDSLGSQPPECENRDQRVVRVLPQPVGGRATTELMARAKEDPPPHGRGMYRRRMAPPVFSVVVLAYQARERIDRPLRSLRRQDLGEAYEVILVDSGSDGCAEYVRGVYPEVRVVRASRRLLPGAARNAGIAASRGDYVAFLADDVAASAGWLRLRLQAHRRGHAAVGGSVVCGRSLNALAIAGQYLEYSAVLPSMRSLAAQQVPHSLSYERRLLARLGPFPELVRAGEDTLFNRRCLETGVSIGFVPEARLYHHGVGQPGAYVRHHVEHGRSLARCVLLEGYSSPIGRRGQSRAVAAARIFGLYPALRWLGSLRRTAAGRPTALPGYLAVAPLAWAGLLATAAGAWSEWRRLSGDAAPPSLTRVRTRLP
jgi:GT2 family glycosyltransferase